MKHSWLVSILAICLTGCSSVNTQKSKTVSNDILQEESAFYVPKRIKATVSDPASTVYTYSKSDIIASVFFDFDKTSPKREYKERIGSAHKFFEQNPNLGILIVGHCDHFGEENYNNQLGLKRAERIKRKLVKLGIDKNRIITASVGSKKAKAGGKTKESTIADRRVDIVSIEK